MHYISHYVYFIVSCGVSFKESRERSEGRDSHNHPALHQVPSHLHDFSKLHKGVPPPIRPEESHGDKAVSRSSSTTLHGKKTNTAQTVTGSNFKGPNFISHHTPGSKKKKKWHLGPAVLLLEVLLAAL